MSGLKFKYGPFIEAYKKGKILILDEINLASISVLQCIEEALDNDFLSIDINGCPFEKIKKHKNFCLIATQNPNSGFYLNKRQNLGLDFLSHFQRISFPLLSKEELEKIALGLSKKFELEKKIKNSEEFIKELVNFHVKWANEEKNDIKCFTVRELAATIKNLSLAPNHFQILMIIYGSRYEKSKKEKLKETLENFPILNSLDKSEFKIPDDFDRNFFCTKSIEKVINSILFSLNNNRHIIITGKEGNGKTKVAKLISNYWNKIKEKEENNYYCVCSENINCSDLIGKQMIVKNLDLEKNNKIIEWKDGFLLKAIKKGKCAILDLIEEAPSTVTERLNSLLDQKYDNQEKKFYVFENPKKKNILIDKNFRLICVSDDLNKMSPAFINRFDIIYFEDQLDQIKLNDLIQYFLNNINNFDINIFCKKDEIEIKEEENKIDIKEENKIKFNEKIWKEKIYEKINNYNKEKTISFIFKLCRSVKIYSYFFNFYNKDLSEKNILKIIDFSFNIITNISNFEIDNDYQIILEKSYIKNDELDYNDKFFYKDSKKLKNFILKLHAASLINLHLVIIGPTGIGKTSCAISYAEKRGNLFENDNKEDNNNDDNNNYYKHSFHLETKPSDFYGTLSLKEKDNFLKGSLYKSLLSGKVFIADELNLSSSFTMKSISPALENIDMNFIYIPGIGKDIKINPNFFFISCQNEEGTIGRNSLPKTLLKRIQEIYYPNQQNDEEIISIIQEIENDLNIKNSNSEKLAKFFIIYNEAIKNKNFPSFSFRDIKKILNRIKYQQENNQKFINFELYHNIIFYCLSSFSEKNLEEPMKIILECLKKIYDNLNI